MQIVIISHTEHYINSKDQVCGWGSTIRELNHLAEICDELIHLAPLHTTPAPDSSLSYTSSKIKFIALKPSGGKGWQKLSILNTALYNLKKINQFTKTADFIQFRAPTGMGVYVLPYLKTFRNSRYWVKYAGNWIDPEMPMGNRLQKYWLKNIDRNAKVTINGTWEKQRRFLSFENPSLTRGEHVSGCKVVKDKMENFPTKLRLIFVGSLNRHKGVHIILEALKNIEDLASFSELILVGDGEDRVEFEAMAQAVSLQVQFLGHRSKPEVADLLSKSHVLLLPSKSEGFPKVVGEAMNFGCVPIVSDISCIGDYIENGVNGLLLDKVDSKDLKQALMVIGQWSSSTFKTALNLNMNTASRFTYQYYNKALIEHVLR